MKVRLIPVRHRNESIEYPAIHNAFMRQGPMTESPQTRRAAQASATDSLLAFLKSLPLPDRLIEGCVMALQAVAGASIAFTIARALHTHQPFWAAITAIAVSQHNYVDTRKLSRDQFLGAMVGGVCGLAGTLLGGGYFVAYMATVAAAIIICWVANIGSAARLGGITATIMLLVPRVGPPWEVALIRLGEVTIGTVSALLVCRLIHSIEQRWFVKS
jgi:uncharacterized membrane protein YccC